MEEINAYIYGKKIGTMIEHQGVIYFEYDKKFKLEGLEISPIEFCLNSYILCKSIGLYMHSNFFIPIFSFISLFKPSDTHTLFLNL